MLLSQAVLDISVLLQQNYGNEMNRLKSLLDETDVTKVILRGHDLRLEKVIENGDIY